jgi:hypothetical protein
VYRPFKMLRHMAPAGPRIFVGALAAVQSSAREYYNDS